MDAKGAVLGSGLRAGKTIKRLDHQSCGQRSLSLRVTRRGSAGPFSLTISEP